MKIVSGVYQPDEGELWIRGEKERLRNPADAQAKGIYLVSQEPILFPYLTIEENILLGMKVNKKLYSEEDKSLDGCPNM